MSSDKRVQTIRADRRDPLYLAVGRRMEQVRIDRGMTMVEVGKALDLHDTTIYFYEMGRNRTPLGVFVRWCAVLDVNPGVILQQAQDDV